ncbi:hypothetical protein DYB32_006178, partial [Aphanomyces invadans]
TKSNEWTGKRTFGGKCLHDVRSYQLNLYEEVVDIVGRTLREFDDDNIIPVYGFGDQLTGDSSVFSFMPFLPMGRPAIPGYALEGVRQRYREIAPHVSMSGPTSFAPVILQAVNTVIANGYSYHILVIVADGQVTRSVDVPVGEFSKQELDTMNAICYASNFPLSIVLVGVGDGPWDMMQQFDDALPQRRFDNFQFVEFDKVTRDVTRRETQFALHALMEIPEQYQAVRRLNLLQPPPRPFPPPFTPMILPPPEFQPFPQGGFNYAPTSSAHVSSAAPIYYPGGAPYQPPASLAQVVVPCPRCTFANRASSSTCALCGEALPANPSAPPPTGRAAEDDPATLSRRLRAMEEELICTICMAAKKNVVFQCGHETCEDCSKNVVNCPSCRLPIRTRTRRYG